MNTTSPSSNAVRPETSAGAPRIPVHRSVTGREEVAAAAQVLQSGWLGHGPIALDFEASISHLTGARHALSVTSGTAALFLALEILDLETGDEVLVPSLTFTGAIQAIVHAGAKPVFCEVDPTTFNLDIADAARRITPRTRVILPTHYAGAPCDLQALRALAREHELFLIDDAAHAFGSVYDGTPIGACCDMTCFSFDPIKTFTCGDGGAITTDNDEFAARLRLARNIGLENDSWRRKNNPRRWDYRTVGTGHRYLMNDLSAAIGRAQLEKFDAIKNRRQEIAAQYDAALTATPGLQLQQREAAAVCPFTYVVRVTNGRRDELMHWLRERGIGTTVPFPLNHRQPAYAEYYQPLPVTEQLIEELLALPMHGEISADDVAEVVASVLEWSASAS